MTTIKQEVSKSVFDHLETLLDEATEQGAEGTIEHFKAVAYGIGAQMAIVSDPEHIPEFIDTVVSELGRGLQVGMQIAHGLNGRLDVQVHSVRRG